MRKNKRNSFMVFALIFMLLMTLFFTEEDHYAYADEMLVETPRVTENTDYVKAIETSKLQVSMNSRGYYALRLKENGSYVNAFYDGQFSETSNIDIEYDDDIIQSWYDLPIEEFSIENENIIKMVRENNVARYTLRLSIVNATAKGGYMKVEMEMENLKPTTQSLGTFLYWDTMIGSNDGSPFEVIENGWRNYDGDFQVSAFLKDTLNVTNADALWMGQWDYRTKGWDDNPPMTWAEHREKIGEAIATDDTAAGAWYDPVPVEPGSSRKISAIIGVGPKNEPPVLSDPSISPDIDGETVEAGDEVVIGGKAGNSDDVGTRMNIVAIVDENDDYRQLLGTVTVYEGQEQEFEYTYRIPEGLAPGEHSLKVYLMDDTGATATLEEITFYILFIDTVAPTNPIIERNPDKDLHNDDYTITLISGEDTGSGVDKTVYRTVYGEVYSSWNTYSEPFTISREGTTKIEAKTIDQSGNESDIVIKTVSINKSLNATLTIVTDPDNQYSSQDYKVKLITEYDDTVQDAVYSNAYYELNNGGYMEYDGPFVISEKGETIIKAKVIDRFGNTSEEIIKKVYIFSKDDEDGDGIPNDEDEYPLDPTKSGKDTDNDGIDDAIDDDDDGDGIKDDEDPYPLDPTKPGKDTGGGGSRDRSDDDSSKEDPTEEIKEDENIVVVEGKEITKIKDIPRGDLEPKDRDMKIKGKIYDVELEENEEVVLKIKYNEEEISNENHLGVFLYDENIKDWKYMGGKVNKEANEITLSLNTSGKITVMEYNKTFNDIQDHWAKDAIEFLASRQILSGGADGNYRPDWGITRAEFATIITKALDINIDTAETGFVDISQDEWFAPYIAAARDKGIVFGISDTEYDPHRIVSREEMTAIIVRAYKNIGDKKANTDMMNLVEKFSDDSKVADWAKEDVYTAKHLKLVKGRTEELFAPTSDTTRAEAATLIFNFLSSLDKI